MKRSLLFLLMCGLVTWGQAQNNAQTWTNKQASQIEVSSEQTLHSYATNYRLVELDRDQVAPMMLSSSKSTRQLTVPLPDGEQAELTIQLDPVMAPGLAAKYPGIKTYKILPDGKHIMGGRLGWTYQGFHATLRTDKGTIYIDPYILEDDRYYVVYNVRDNINTDVWSGFECGNEDNTSGNLVDPSELFPSQDVLDSQEKNLTGAPVMLRTYRTIIACTGEFSNFHDGADNIATTEESMAAIVTIINRVNEVFARDLSIRLELIDGMEQVIYLNAADDPYDNSSTADLMDGNQTVMDLNFGDAVYDLGHVLSTGPSVGGGIAQLQGVCSGSKARGSSTRAAPQGDPFVINILCHEMGHQLGAQHVTSGCQNVNPGTAVEPGGGSTIMSYAGICPNGYNIASASEDYYNANSLEQIFQHTRVGNGTCGTTEDLNNTTPDVTLDYENDFYIPISTPFELTGAAMDTEGDDMTYTWEQIDFELSIVYDDDNGVYGPLPGSPVGDSPLFRSLYPSNSLTRVFPNMQSVVTNESGMIDEVLPTYSRNLTFRFAARDNHSASGAVGWADVAFNSTDNSGPFLVMSPNTTSDVWTVGDYTEVTWDVANTTASPVNCQRVNIRLSMDGGFTYPIMLLEGTPNTGSAFVSVPDQLSTQARVRVEAAENIFFDISNANFSIEPATEASYTLSNNPLYQAICSSELAEVDFVTANVLDFSGEVTLDIVSSIPVGVTTSFSAETMETGQSSTLTLDFSESDFDGLLTVEVRSISTADDTTYRSFNVEVYNENFSDLALVGPVDGLTGVVLSEDFSWTLDPSASSYDLQISYSPDFETDLFEEALGLETNSYTPNGLFDGNELVFWRVRGNNECGGGAWSRPFTLHTEIISCNEFSSSDTPLNIPGTGPVPTITSILNVELTGEIGDVNVSAVDVVYSPVQNFLITLVSPAGTRVLLYDASCFSTDRIYAGFDDQAPQTLVCPPTNGIVYQPAGSLADFIGEDSQGEWQLEVKVTETGNGSSGSIGDWSIEFCTTAPEASAPSILNNQTLFVPPLLSNPISEDLLSVADEDQNPLELEYTIVTTPEHGTLYYRQDGWNELTIGSTFRQASINAYNIRYENTNGDATNDAFTFIVQDGTGGFLPVEQFNIVIDADALVGVNDLVEADQFRLFPNPATESVTLEWGEMTKDELPLKVYNLQGQLMSKQTLATGVIQVKLDTSKFPAGVYIVQVGMHTERLVIH